MTRIESILTAKVGDRPNSIHLDCTYLDCPYRADKDSRKNPNRTVDCINDTIVDRDYLVMCPPACRISKEHGKEWANRVGLYEISF